MATDQDNYSPEENVVPRGYGTILYNWDAPEHEPLELGPRSRIIVTVLLVSIIAYALFTNSPLMAITFILAGVLGYLILHRPPQMLSFSVTSRGIIAGNQFYEFDNIHSFWVYNEPPFENLLSLHTTGALLPYVHIPIPSVDREQFLETLENFIPLEKHEPRLVDTLERLLHI